MVHVRAAPFIIFVDHGVPSTHPGRVISSITAVVTADAQPIGASSTRTVLALKRQKQRTHAIALRPKNRPIEY